MASFLENKSYRKDIDGLRAIAVIAVILFHSGYLPNGFLGVDIFFVISGYLITKILYIEIQEERLSIKNFYIRRFRRIIPLVLFFCVLVLGLGVLFMLPDDLENLAQSLVATILFSNNILLYITNGDYYDVINDIKPFMHTWSLGIEEQFYVLYPIVLYLFRKKARLLLPVIIVLSIGSLALYLAPFNEANKFFNLPFRFYELSIGGIGAIILVHKQIHLKFRFLLIALLAGLLLFDIPFLPHLLLIPITCVVTLFVLITGNPTDVSKFLLENKVIIWIGKISFSVYMWHQVILAFTRYSIVQEITLGTFFLLFAIILFLSYLTYRFIETPFRNKQTITNGKLFTSLIVISIAVLACSFLIYLRAGVIKDVPELNISKSVYSRSMHSRYIRRINKLDKHFTKEDNLKVAVYGNSFSNDWSNVLLESRFSDKINVVQFNHLKNHPDLAKEADVIFFARLSKTTKSELSIDEIQNFDQSIKDKIWCVGTKNFGVNNGIFYNHVGDDYCDQRTEMEHGYLEENIKLKKEWGPKYIDLIGLLKDESNLVPVFTPDCKFMSQDTRHLTPSGAKHVGLLVDDQLAKIFQIEDTE